MDNSLEDLMKTDKYKEALKNAQEFISIRGQGPFKMIEIELGPPKSEEEVREMIRELREKISRKQDLVTAEKISTKKIENICDDKCADGL